MVCKSCVQKWTRYYVEKGFLERQAKKMANKLVKRIEKRQKRESIIPCFSWINVWSNYYRMKGFNKQKAEKMAKKLIKRLDARLKASNDAFIPIYLLENQAKGQDILLFTRQPETGLSLIKLHLRRWAFKTNWKATFFWSFRLHQLRWIGQGYNPDYTQVCTQSTCASTNTCSKWGVYCTTNTPCSTSTGSCGVSGSCACIAPLPNSTQTSGCTVTCTASGSCKLCDKSFEECGTCDTNVCSAGTCGFTCDPGYTWNGSQCAAAGSGQQLFTLINQEDY